MRHIFQIRILPLVLVALLAAGCQTTTAPVPAKQPTAHPQEKTPPPPESKPEETAPAGPQVVPDLAVATEPEPVERAADEPAQPAPAVVEKAPSEKIVISEVPPPLAPVFTPPSVPAAIETKPEPAPKSKTVSFLHPGEVLEFRMGWKIFSHVGDTRIETIEETVDGKEQLRINISTKSRGLLDAIYPVVNDSVSILDPATGRPLSISVEGKSGSRPEKTQTVFDYDKHEVVHTDFIRPQKSGKGELPSEPAYDLMVAMLKSREWHMKPGEVREVLTVFDQDIYFIQLTALERESVNTDIGRFDAVKIEATQKGEQRGYFKKGGSFRYWVREGNDPQVLRMQFKTNAGTLTATLHEVTRGKVQ